MLTRSQLKDLFSKYDFRPLKRFGENYLIDSNIKDKIISEVKPSKDDIILEVGPGMGALTVDLAESGANLHAVEKDKKAYAILGEILDGDFPNLKIHNSDILDFDLASIAAGRKVKFVGNLPYYITTPIVEYIIENKILISSAVITVQREVANRLMAGPGTKEYGSISCFVQYHTKLSYIHTINRTSFYPEPEVDSSVIRLDILDKPPVVVKDEKLFFKVIRSSFNQRRKTIINSLSREAALDIPKEELSKILKRAGIEPSIRPESLGISDFAKICNAING